MEVPKKGTSSDMIVTYFNSVLPICDYKGLAVPRHLVGTVLNDEDQKGWILFVKLGKIMMDENSQQIPSTLNFKSNLRLLLEFIEVSQYTECPLK